MGGRQRGETERDRRERRETERGGVERRETERDGRDIGKQTPSTGLQHPSWEEGTGKRCSECEREAERDGGSKGFEKRGGRQGDGRKEKGDTQRGREQARERERRSQENERKEGGDTRREGGREQEKRKGEDREMEGRTPYTVTSKHILKGNEWVTHLSFMRIRSARSICKICSLASESDNKS